jgi:hypothetical protein
MLNLHFVQKNSAILGQFNLTGTSDQHLNCTFGAKVSLQYFLKTFSSVDVDTKGLSFSDDISVSVD